MRLATKHRELGFTLIELSVVLVIVGLIVGGILAGRDLIKAAEVRAQLSQIERYNQAVNTFKSKFGALPGDMPVSIANQFGFTVGSGCGGTVGERDGNGLIDGVMYLYSQNNGETGLFWGDLGSAAAGNLIDAQIPSNGAAAISCSGAPGLNTTPGTTYVGDYFPQAKIGYGNFIYVYEYNGFNWFGVAALTGQDGSGTLSKGSTIPVIDAYRIDSKIDDGLPFSGTVNVYEQMNAGLIGAGSPPSETATTCGYTQPRASYSLDSITGYGAAGNCLLSFRFQ